MYKYLLSFLLCLCGCFAAQAQICSSPRYHEECFPFVDQTSNIYFATAQPYGLAGPQDLYLDIYEPAGDTAALRPMIIYSFGGAFLIGTRNESDIPAFAAHYAKLGYVFVSIDYRLGFNPLSATSAVRAVYRGIQDLRAAVRFMCVNNGIYKVDTTKIIFSGSSAGCISAIESSYLTEADRPSETYFVALEGPDMGCLECSGNTLYGGRSPQPLAILNRWGAIQDTNLMDLSPHDNVPMISFAGTLDNAVPYVSGHPFSYPVFPTMYGSLSMHQRLDNIGVKNQLVPLVDAGHEPELLNSDWDDTIYKYSAPFLYDLIKPAPLHLEGPLHVCAGDTVRYTAHGQAGSRFCWQVDAAGIMVAQADSYIMVYWPSSGFYQVNANETSNINAIGDEVSVAVEVLPLPVANFGDSIHGLQLTFFDSCINAPYRTWFFGDGSRSNAIAPIHSYPDSGIYHITLVADNHYCTDTMYKELHMYQCPSADFAINDMGSQRIYFIATSQYASAYHWSFGDGTSDTVQYLSHQFPNGGTYTVQLILDNGHGCFDTITKQIKVGGVGIAGLKNQGFSIYPNPAKDQLSIICEQSEEYQYKLINELGKELLSGTFHASRFNLSVVQLPAGVYCLQLRSSMSMCSQKLIIER